MQVAWICRIVRLAAFCVAAIGVVPPAFGSAFSTDNSDIYNAANESGWAVELVQRGDVIFATIYTYDANKNPIFYSASLFFGGTDASGNAIWVGDLYVTTGPWFGGPFDPSKVVYRKVGTMNYVPQFTESGVVSFTIDGVAVSKQISRVTFRLDNYAGTYQGTYKVVASGCLNQSNNGTFYTDATFTVTQGNNALTIVATDDAGDSCTFPGDYMQFGQFGQSRGSFTCTTGINGGNLFFEMNVTPTDFRGRLLGTDNLGCSLTGSIAGVRN
jgi:hypothetical protein